NPATQYQFEDDGTAANSAYFWTPDNPHHAAGATFTVSAADLANDNVWLHGGQNGGTAVIWQRPNHATDWSPWSMFTVTTLPNYSPVATIASHSLSTNDCRDLQCFPTRRSSDLNPATQYQFEDDGTAPDSGYFWTPDNQHHAAGSTFTVSAADLANDNVW